MQRSIWAVLGAAILVVGATTYAQTHAQSSVDVETALGAGKSGTNVGSLTCHAAGGKRFVFGASRELNCLFARTDGIAEPYHGTIKKFGADTGFAKDAHVVWLVFAPAALGDGSLSGSYGDAAAGVAAGAELLVGGGSRQITLQPVSVEGSAGLNVATGLAEVQLTSGS
ncbi:MAG: DUF992 domain-containing protein [Proteobacteria bacterium]|nr:DUF992 domain-containing protein [Pseudomonadota bacterium]